MLKLKHVSLLFAVLLVFNLFASNFVFAEETSEPKAKIVSLGDSISFGYVPKESNSSPSPIAFPNLILGGNQEVVNLSVPGATSIDLLNSINATVLTEVEDADLITINTGSNDILKAIGFSEILRNQTPITDPVLLAQIQSNALQTSHDLASNLSSIFATIRSNSDAPIFIYNIYNPFPAVDQNVSPFGSFLNIVGGQIAAAVNVEMASQSQALSNIGVFIIDAYSAFDGNQSSYVFPMDIHPTPEGHAALATITTQKLVELMPEPEPEPVFAIKLSASTSQETEGPVTVYVETENKEDVQHLFWLKGDKSIEDFRAGGNDISESFSFEVTENGTYTVLALHNQQLYALEKIDVTNIVPTVEPPVEEEPPAEEDPPVDEEPPAKEEENTPPPPVKKEETKQPVEKKPVAKSGNKLPNTATPSNNYLVLGAGLLFVGFAYLAFVSIHKRKTRFQ